MTFNPRISAAAMRMQQSNDDLWQVHHDALGQLAQGEDVILMSVGDPDLPTIDSIIEHAVTSLYRGRTHYSPGMGEPALRETIADIETKASGRVTGIDEIVIFPGATNAIYTALSCLLDEGDDLVIVDPSYVGYEGMFQTIGCSVTRVASDPAKNFAVATEDVIAAFSEKTRVLLLNTPGNPSGHVMSMAQLSELAAICLKENIWLVCDEVYSMITFEKPHISVRKAAASLDNVIVVDGLSKSHAMTGWRLGWVVARPTIIEHLLNFTSATVFGCSQFIQDAAAYAMQNDAEYIRSIVAEYQSRRDYACQRIEQIEGLAVQKPDAGMFMLVDVSGVSKDGQSFATGLLANEKVSVLPGAGFGAVTTSFIRVSLTHPVDVLAGAFERIERHVASLRQFST